MNTQLAVPGDTREQLLVAASLVMREADAVDISLAELSRKSGLNSALVKYYFGNKAGLMKELLARDMRGIVQSADALVAKGLNPETKLRRHLSALADAFYQAPYVQRLLVRLIRESDACEAERIANTYLRPIYRAYDRLIEEGVVAGTFRALDPKLFYFSVIGAADGFFSSRLFLRYCAGKDSPTDELRNRYRQHMIDFVMAGLMKDK